MALNETNPIQELADRAGLSLDIVATAVLLSDPGASLAEIARKLGVDRGRIYRLPGFMRAWRIHRLTDHCPLPHGTKDREGNLEAFREHPEKF